MVDMNTTEYDTESKKNYIGHQPPAAASGPADSMEEVTTIRDFFPTMYPSQLNGDWAAITIIALIHTNINEIYETEIINTICHHSAAPSAI